MIVYRHIRKDNCKTFYVGIGSREDRAYTKHGRSGLWNNITNKYDYDVEIIAKGLSKEDAIELEVFLIEQYEGKLCNFTVGGEVGALGYKHTKEALNKISEASKINNKGRVTSEETKDKLRKVKLGSKWGEYQLKTMCEPVLQYDKKGNFIKEFISAVEAGRKLNINSGNISSCRNGNRKSAGGFIWKHKN